MRCLSLFNGHFRVHETRDVYTLAWRISLKDGQVKNGWDGTGDSLAAIKKDDIATVSVYATGEGKTIAESQIVSVIGDELAEPPTVPISYMGTLTPANGARCVGLQIFLRDGSSLRAFVNGFVVHEPAKVKA